MQFRKHCLFFFVSIIPVFSYAQQPIPDSLFREGRSSWKVLLAISEGPFTHQQIEQWKKITGKPVNIYRDKKGQYRAMVDASVYWFRSVRYRDSLISAGIPEAVLINVYGDRFTIRYWGKNEDIGEPVHK